MNASLKSLLLGLLCFVGVIASSAGQDEPLASVASQTLIEGKEGSMNAGFATMLGLTSNKPLPIKQLTAERDGATNRLAVSLADKRTIIITTRSNHLSTYYLTDVSGKLKQAIVNDGSVRSGGLTNLSVAVAEPRFEQEKEWWSKRQSR
jgi:hypothetical protein